MVITRRLPSYRFEPDSYIGQAFSPLVTEYHYNAVKNILEPLPVKVDTDKKIDSYKNFALDKVLDKFLPNEVDPNSEIIDCYDDQLDDLDILLEASEYAEQMRRKYKLDDDLSYIEVMDFVAKKNAETLVKLKAMAKAREEFKGGDSDVEKKKIEQKGESA